ncbi:MAG: hypothetical protein AB8B79_01160 [Granulosicoccus sp.]
MHAIFGYAIHKVLPVKKVRIPTLLEWVNEGVKSMDVFTYRMEKTAYKLKMQVRQDLVEHKRILNTVVRYSDNTLHWTTTSTADTHITTRAALA